MVTQPAAEPAEQQPVIPDHVLRYTASWIREFSLDFHRETPLKLHSSATDDGGGPSFHPDFIRYIDRPCRKEDCYDLRCKHGQNPRNPDSRLRTTRAFRKLRRQAPREFDVLYLICAHQMTLKDVSKALTDRAIRIGKPERYDEGGVLVLAVLGVDKLVKWW